MFKEPARLDPRDQVSRSESKLQQLFGIDFRSLAVFRIAVALLILIDLFQRSRFLQALYTDLGVLPRQLVGPRPPQFSIYLIDGSYGFQLLAFGLAGIFALMLLVGYRTRVSTIGSWLMLVSLHARQFLLHDGGDLILSMMLFWAIFLPLGACLAIDGRRDAAPRSSPTLLSAATVAILIQFVLFYCFAGLHKTGPQWSEGNAIELVLANSYWGRPLGEFLQQFPELLRVLTPAVRYFEIFGPFLMFVPLWTGPIRMLMIAVFWIFQIGLGLTIQLNLFPWIATATTLLFMPGWFWDRIGFRLQAELPARDRSGSAPGGWLAFYSRIGWRSVLNNGCISLLLAYAIFLNLKSLDGSRLPTPLQVLSRTLAMQQRWRLYPNPAHETFAVELLGTLEDGNQIQLIDTPGGLEWEKARRIHDDYRFKTYLESLLWRVPRPEPLQQAYLRWVCRQWNTGPSAAEKLVRVDLFYRVWNIHPDRPIRIRRLFKSSHDCTSGRP